MPLPFTLRSYVEDRPNVFMFALPTSRGMTNYKTIKLAKKALVPYDDKRAREIYFAALENNLDAQSLFKSAKSAVKADKTYDDKKMAREILKEIDKLAPNAREDAMNVYEQRGILTQGIINQIIKLLEKESSIKRQRSAFGIRAGP